MPYSHQKRRATTWYSDAAKMLIKAATERFLKAKPHRGEIKQKSQLSRVVGFLH